MVPGFDPTITLGNIIEIVTIAGGGLWFIVKMNTSIVVLKTDIGMMKTEIGKIGDVLTQLAVTHTRLNNVEQDIRELRHGHGWVKGSGGIDREYP